MKKKTISTTIATGLLLAPMALGLVANQAPAATVHAATSTIAKTPSNNALANWTANTQATLSSKSNPKALTQATPKPQSIRFNGATPFGASVKPPASRLINWQLTTTLLTAT